MASARKLPAVRPAQAAAIAALPAPAVITRNRWEKGGARILHANAMFCRLTGYSMAELVGQNTRLLHGPKTDLPLLQHGRSDHQSSGEGWLYRKDGTPFFAQWNFGPLGATGGRGGQLVGLYYDHSEMKRLRDALLQSQKLDTVGLLTGGVAHDFNNLLSVINGYCEILTRKLARRTGIRKDLDEIHRAGLKAAAIARQILEFSRRQEAEVKVVNFNTLIREITEILRRVAGETVALEFRLASDLGNARIDPTQFQQILLNLCFNAREAMPVGGRLTIRTFNHRVAAAADRRTADMTNGLYAALGFTDNGSGMDPGTLGRIFEPFFTTKPQGTGLGLATVLGIVHQHDGHITVESAPGAGTTFEVFLPVTPEPEQAAPRQLASLPATQGTETLLIVEEDAVLRKMIAGILVTDGYKVVDVATAEAATAALATGGLRPQLVLARGDNRPVAALLRKLYARNPALRFIAVSAEPPAALLPEMPARAMMHLPKPFALSALMLGVRTLLDAKGQ